MKSFRCFTAHSQAARLHSGQTYAVAFFGFLGGIQLFPPT